MIVSADTLWRLNQEYGNRLSKARTYLELLEQLVSERGGGDEDLYAALQYIRAHLNGLKEEYRGWRYTYFYETADTKRMVQSESAIRRAISAFARMRTRHEQYLNELFGALDTIQRPHPEITTVPPNGDLWEMLRFALFDLLDFGSYAQTLDSSR
jgi:hypothetical protein